MSCEKKLSRISFLQVATAMVVCEYEFKSKSYHNTNAKGWAAAVLGGKYSKHAFSAWAYRHCGAGSAGGNGPRSTNHTF